MRTTRYALGVALGLIALMIPAHALADITTNYDINFTTTAGAPAPISGSFTYDSTNPSFSNFQLEWNGITFDLTANVPSSDNNVPTNCTGESAKPAYGFDLITQQLTGCTVTYSWQALSGSGVSGFEFDAFSTTILGGNDQLLALSLATPTNASAIAQGTWSVTPVPEPPSVQFAALGLLFLTLITWRRNRLA